MRPRLALSIRFFVPFLFLLVALIACGTSADTLVFKVGGIPDQNSARLARRYQSFAAYLSRELEVNVRYVPSVDYAAVVTAFSQGGLQLAFFGGLTGVQARLQNPGARAIAQRESDARFHSKFIVRTELEIDSLEDLKQQASDLTITFGSESSTSGHLMPRYFLSRAGIDAANDFKSAPNYSGSHDLTWQLVASGSFDVGALNEEVWQRAVQTGRADAERVRQFYTTPGYFDYNWTVGPEVDQIYGDGFSAKLQQALLALNPEEHGEILELFSTRKFIASKNENYRGIEDVARSLGIVR